MYHDRGYAIVSYRTCIPEYHRNIQSDKKALQKTTRRSFPLRLFYGTQVLENATRCSRKLDISIGAW